MSQAGQVILLQVFENQEAVDRRRGAEGCDPELAQDVQGHLGVEAALGVVLDDRSALGPLTEELAICGLGPPGVGDRPLHVGRAEVVPELGGDDVGNAVGSLGVEHHLGVAHGAGGEIDHERVIASGGLDIFEIR